MKNIEESIVDLTESLKKSGLSILTDNVIIERIEKIGKKKWRLYSKKGRNLGTFRSLKAAKNHEREVKFLKKKGKK